MLGPGGYWPRVGTAGKLASIISALTDAAGGGGAVRHRRTLRAHLARVDVRKQGVLKCGDFEAALRGLFARAQAGRASPNGGERARAPDARETHEAVVAMVIDARANKGGSARRDPTKEIAYGPLVALLEDDPITRLVYAGAGGSDADARADASFFIVESEDDGGGFYDAEREARIAAAAKVPRPDPNFQIKQRVHFDSADGLVEARIIAQRPNGRYDIELKEDASGGQAKPVAKLAVRGVDRRLLREIEEKKPKPKKRAVPEGERAIKPRIVSHADETLRNELRAAGRIR